MTILYNKKLSKLVNFIFPFLVILVLTFIAVYPTLRQDWACKAVPDVKGGKGQRKPLPEEWRGLPAEKLREVTGVESAIFCHPAGFMCSAGTREDAIKMAELAMMR